MKTSINKYLLSIMIIFSFSSLIACSKDKQDNEASVNACLFDPTGNCARAVMAQCQSDPTKCSSLASSPAVLPYLNGQNPTTQQPPVVAPATTATTTVSGNGVAIASVSNSQIKQQAMKVQSAIEADNNNPDSLHYDPAVKQALESARMPAQVQAAFSAPAQPVVPEASDNSGDGVAAR